jgi:hypothetical protein
MERACAERALRLRLIAGHWGLAVPHRQHLDWDEIVGGSIWVSSRGELRPAEIQDLWTVAVSVVQKNRMVEGQTTRVQVCMFQSYFDSEVSHYIYLWLYYSSNRKELTNSPT